MQKGKLSLTQEQKSFTPKMDDAGGGGGIGKGNLNSGGGGDDDDDDDDYENEEGDEGEDGPEGLWWHKTPLTQLYDQANVRAVLSVRICLDPHLYRSLTCVPAMYRTHLQALLQVFYHTPGTIVLPPKHISQNAGHIQL